MRDGERVPMPVLQACKKSMVDTCVRLLPAQVQGEILFQRYECTTSKGRTSLAARRYAEAVDLFTAAISACDEPTSLDPSIFCNRAAAFQALGQFIDAIVDCTLAITLDPSHSEAIFRRSTLHETLGDYDHAAADLSSLVKLLEPPTLKRPQEDIVSVRERLRRVEAGRKKGLAINHHLVLGVRVGAPVEEVKRAYRQAVLRFHPDKAALLPGAPVHTNQAICSEFTRLFKVITEAYNVLSDPQKAAELDVGSKGFATVAEEVSLDDMDCEPCHSNDIADRDEMLLYTYACRCGDSYELHSDEIAEAISGDHLPFQNRMFIDVPCASCSLHIRVEIPSKHNVGQ